ncbi:hypothetical protein D8Y20_10945 [Mariprofundus sp. EBB-1]|nr:hypothetical protein D8Y20_10945 [Mariprofundus sp. EBB-1]
MLLLLSGCGVKQFTYSHILNVDSELKDHCIRKALKETPGVLKVTVPSEKSDRNESQAFLVSGKQGHISVYRYGYQQRLLELQYQHRGSHLPSEKEYAKYDVILWQIEHSLLDTCGTSEAVQ